MSYICASRLDWGEWAHLHCCQTRWRSAETGGRNCASFWEERVQTGGPKTGEGVWNVNILFPFKHYYIRVVYWPEDTRSDVNVWGSFPKYREVIGYLKLNFVLDLHVDTKVSDWKIKEDWHYCGAFWEDCSWNSSYFVTVWILLLVWFFMILQNNQNIPSNILTHPI